MAFGTTGHETVKLVSVSNEVVGTGAAGGGSRVVINRRFDGTLLLLFVAVTTIL